MTPNYLQVILSLVAVMVCLWLAIYALKRLQGHAYQKNSLIHILQSIPVGTKEKILLLEVNNLQLLVGVTATQIQPLHVFSASSQLPSTKHFSETLNAVQATQDNPHD